MCVRVCADSRRNFLRNQKKKETRPKVSAGVTLLGNELIAGHDETLLTSTHPRLVGHSRHWQRWILETVEPVKT